MPDRSWIGHEICFNYRKAKKDRKGIDMNTFDTDRNEEDIALRQAGLRRHLTIAFGTGALAGLLMALIILLAGQVIPGFQPGTSRTLLLCTLWCGIVTCCGRLLQLLVRR